jgi:uncharacterized membrane protein
MTWQQRYRISRFLRDSIWLALVVVMVLVLLAHPLVGRLDGILGVKAVIGAETARALLAALASSMLTFIVFVFSIMLVTVQLASAQLTPRIIATFVHSGILRFSLTVFVFAFAFTLEALSQVGDSVPQIATDGGLRRVQLACSPPRPGWRFSRPLHSIFSLDRRAL